MLSPIDLLNTIFQYARSTKWPQAEYSIQKLNTRLVFNVRLGESLIKIVMQMWCRILNDTNQKIKDIKTGQNSAEINKKTSRKRKQAYFEREGLSWAKFYLPFFNPYVSCAITQRYPHSYASQWCLLSLVLCLIRNLVP